MDLDLAHLRPPKGATKKPKRVGRGPGSGHGKTSCHGHKGHQARSGYKRQIGKEGGQMPLQRRLPKRGFCNIFRVEYQAVNLVRLAAIAGVDRIDPEVMLKHRIIRSLTKPIKILAAGELTRPVTIVAHAVSEAARQKIQSAGGTFEEPKSC
jgi:large subunit ribosomal protein L15